MEWIHWVLDSLFGALLFLAGIVMKNQDDRTKTLEDKHEKIVETYARKDDVTRQFDQILSGIRDIDSKLEKMRDNLHHG